MPVWLVAVLGILPALISLAEGLFGSGKGEEKKNSVVSLVGAFLGLMTSVSTGPQLALWKMLTPMIGPIVDALAGILFPKGQTVTSTEAVKMASRFIKGDFGLLEERVSLIDKTTGVVE